MVLKSLLKSKKDNKMDVVEYINENVDHRKILEYYNFKNIQEYSDSFRASCAIHNGNNPTAFIFKKNNNLWYCFTGDCQGGDVFSLVMKLEKCSFKDSIIKLAEILNLEVSDISFAKRTNYLLYETKRWLQFMNNHFGNKENEEYTLPHTTYKETNENFNRFNYSTIQYFNARFSDLYPTDKKTYTNKMVIPLYYNEYINGVALRSIDEQLPKWIFQPSGLRVGNLLYNYDAVKNLKYNEDIILTEGIFDVWAYHEAAIPNAVAIFGSTLKKEQKNTLLKSGKNLILSFDNDESGIRCTEEIIKQLNLKCNIEIVTLKENYDPADCTKAELQTAYLNRVKWQEWLK